MSLIKIKSLFKNYRIGEIKNTVLKNISLTISAGELVAIIGASGSGKSTLMNIIGLLDHADEGEYWLENKNVAYLTQDMLAAYRNQQIGFVFQQFHLLPRFTAAQNIALPLIYRNATPALIKKRVSEVLEQVGMQAFSHHKPTQLSGGQQQRIAIGRALVGNPKVILADEPTGALDSNTGHEILNLFLELHAQQRTVILITHDERVATECKRRVLLADGQIIKDDNS